MRYVIDRFEGKYAICLDDSNNRIEIEISRLPGEAREGASVDIDADGIISMPDDAGRVKRIAEKMRDIWR